MSSKYYKKQQGYLLLELQITIAITVLLSLLCYKDFCLLLQGWQHLRTDMYLRDAGRYMQSILAKDLGYEGKLLTLTTDAKGDCKIICATNYAGKTFTYTLERNGLYKQTKTITTTGKNPLFIPDCQVVEWQAEKLDVKRFYLQFTLAKNGRQRIFTQYIHCLNGTVIKDE